MTSHVFSRLPVARTAVLVVLAALSLAGCAAEEPDPGGDDAAVQAVCSDWRWDDAEPAERNVARFVDTLSAEEPSSDLPDLLAAARQRCGSAIRPLDDWLTESRAVRSVAEDEVREAAEAAPTPTPAPEPEPEPAPEPEPEPNGDDCEAIHDYYNDEWDAGRLSEAEYDALLDDLFDTCYALRDE